MSLSTLAYNATQTSVLFGIKTVSYIGSSVLKNPRITALATTALALLSLPTVSGGPVSGIACYVSCVGAATAATGGALLPAAVAACNQVCLATTLCPFLP